MTTANTLKEKCRTILDIYPPENRHGLKVQLRRWIQNPGTNITTEDVDSLDLNELGIFMSWGAYGELYNHANDRLKDLKGRPRPLAETRPTGRSTPQGVTRALDKKRGIDQFKQDDTEAVLRNSDDETLQAFHEMIHTEIMKRHPEDPGE